MKEIVNVGVSLLVIAAVVYVARKAWNKAA